MVAVARWLETSETPEMVHHILEQLDQTRIYRMVMADVEALCHLDPVSCVVIQQIWDQVTDTLHQDLEKIRQMIVNIPTIHKILQWIEKHLDNVSS